jgi:hypothetical protein
MMTVMTPEHPRWVEFIRKMTAKGFCGGGFTFAIKTLKEMKMNVPRSIKYFNENGAECDCEIVYNIYTRYPSDFDDENDHTEISERYYNAILEHPETVEIMCSKHHKEGMQ